MRGGKCGVFFEFVYINQRMKHIKTAWNIPFCKGSMFKYENLWVARFYSAEEPVTFLEKSILYAQHVTLLYAWLYKDKRIGCVCVCILTRKCIALASTQSIRCVCLLHKFPMLCSIRFHNAIIIPVMMFVLFIKNSNFFLSSCFFAFIYISFGIVVYLYHLLLSPEKYIFYYMKTFFV